MFELKGAEKLGMLSKKTAWYNLLVVAVSNFTPKRNGTTNTCPRLTTSRFGLSTII